MKSASPGGVELCYAALVASSQGRGMAPSLCSAYSRRLQVCVESRQCQERGMEACEG